MEKEILIDFIQKAFANVSREDGMTLYQALAIDHLKPDNEVHQARLKDKNIKWEDIDPSSLRGKETALYFLDPKGFRYYLPAFMIACLIGYADEYICFLNLVQFSLSKNISQRQTTPEMIIEKYQFNKEQTKAVALFIEYFSESILDFHNKKVDAESIEKWRKCIND